MLQICWNLLELGILWLIVECKLRTHVFLCKSRRSMPRRLSCIHQYPWHDAVTCINYTPHVLYLHVQAKIEQFRPSTAKKSIPSGMANCHLPKVCLSLCQSGFIPAASSHACIWFSKVWFPATDMMECRLINSVSINIHRSLSWRSLSHPFLPWWQWKTLHSVVMLTRFLQ